MLAFFNKIDVKLVTYLFGFAESLFPIAERMTVKISSNFFSGDMNHILESYLCLINNPFHTNKSYQQKNILYPNSPHSTSYRSMHGA